MVNNPSNPFNDTKTRIIDKMLNSRKFFANYLSIRKDNKLIAIKKLTILSEKFARNKDLIDNSRFCIAKTVSNYNYSRENLYHLTVHEQNDNIMRKEAITKIKKNNYLFLQNVDISINNQIDDGRTLKMTSPILLQFFNRQIKFTKIYGSPPIGDQAVTKYVTNSISLIW
ncbi:hypothetical protein BpHYR1_046315 [Brachionus plicatilis]|uniref:Uncharacterized protein n=1 Tax=Brachionus plicatilis TaxID=10195 RepID=A0A3M7SFS2_BRAPC|nr:hypothetical protein BpHYR1_046315 [Brachionus plicatilis]